MPDDAFDATALMPPEVLAAVTAALAADAEARDAEFAAVCAAYSEHVAALHRVRADLLAIEWLLDGGDGPATPVPEYLGPYRVLRRLGGGAFGEVFLCAQEEPVRREVAVKVLRAGTGDRSTLLRFAAERQLIASLQHPAIAQVFDAGALADGRPYFVMDAIDGRPLDRYCDEQELSVEARIELFCDLCRGVQHAHEHGIVHRDLKPANVLVVEIDGRPRPKVIDFGIAKVLRGSRVPRAFDTEAGRVVGTPGYMSPEQLRGASDDVDARADVFGLGVMLYELLCGQMPWSAAAAAATTEPQRPSTRVSSRSAAATVIARQRATDPRRLASRLRGELDWIVLKCLQHARDERYQSAQQLVDDLERHRRSEPVRARPPSTTYRLRKFVRRHRTAMLAAGGAVVVLTVGLSWEGAATAKIEASFADAAAAVALLVERANDPAVREAPQGDAARKAMLADALVFYDRFLRDRPTDPSLRAERCRALIGLSHVHWLLGDAQRATEFATAAIEEGDAACAADPANLEFRGLSGEARCRHGIARSLAGDDASALAEFRAASGPLAEAAAAMPAKFAHPYIGALRGAATSMPRLASGDRLDGLRAALVAVERWRSVDPPLPAFAYEYVLTACALVTELRMTNRLSEAQDVLRQAEEVLSHVTHERSHLTWRVTFLRAAVAFQAGERRTAIDRYQAALAAAVTWQHEQPNRMLPRAMRCRSLRALGRAQNYAGDLEASDASYREAIALGNALLQQFPQEASSTEELAGVLEDFAHTLYDRFRHGVLAEAAACIERAIEIEIRNADGAGPEPWRWRMLGLQASIADARTAGGGDPYWPVVEAALPAAPSPRPIDNDQVLGLHAGVARWHLDHGRTAAARAVLDRADVLIATSPEFHAKRTVEIGWLTARVAAAGADHAACMQAADRVLAARPTWYGQFRAADCLHLAWRGARLDPASAQAAASYRDRALDLYRQVRSALDADVAKDPDDPWVVLPWAVSGLRAAELTATDDATGALALLAVSLPRLDAVRADAHADQWNEQAYRDGLTLREQLAASVR